MGNIYDEGVELSASAKMETGGSDKRGDKSWNYFPIFFGSLLTIDSAIVSITNGQWLIKIISIIVSGIIIFYLCFFNTFIRNKIVCIMSKSQEKIEDKEEKTEALLAVLGIFATIGAVFLSTDGFVITISNAVGEIDNIKIDSNMITAISTLLLAVITIIYVILVYRTLKETERSRKIQSIENSFEKLYYPLQYVLKKSIIQYDSIRNEINKIGNKRMLEAGFGLDEKDKLNVEENPDVFNAWQTIIRNYYYFRKDYDKIIRFTYLAHSKNLEEELQKFIEDPGGNEILRLIEILDENWNNLGTAKIEEIRKSIDVDSFLTKMINNCNNRRPKLTVMISEDIERLKYERNKLIG